MQTAFQRLLLQTAGKTPLQQGCSFSHDSCLTGWWEELRMNPGFFYFNVKIWCSTDTKEQEKKIKGYKIKDRSYRCKHKHMKAAHAFISCIHLWSEHPREKRKQPGRPQRKSYKGGRKLYRKKKWQNTKPRETRWKWLWSEQTSEPHMSKGKHK